MYDYSTSTSYETTTDIFSGLAEIMGVISIITILIGIIGIVSQWIIYKKAGKGGWESIIPIYNQIVLLQIVGLPIWYIVLLFVPIANIYAMFKMYIELAHKFGKSTGFGVATVFFNFICLPILAFDKKCVYNGTNNNTSNSTNDNVNEIPATPQNNNNQENENINNNQGPIVFTPAVNTDLNPIGQGQGPLQFNPLQPSQTENNDLNQSNPTQQTTTTAINQTTNNQPQNQDLNVIPNMVSMQQPTLNIIPTSEPIQQTSTSNMNLNQTDLSQQQTTIPTSLDNPSPQINVVSGIQTSTEAINQQSELVPSNQGLNVIPGMGTISTPVENNPINNQINQIPQSIQEPVSTQMNNSQQPLNVIPSMGHIAQPSVTMQNPENNQNI